MSETTKHKQAGSIQAKQSMLQGSQPSSGELSALFKTNYRSGRMHFFVTALCVYGLHFTILFMVFGDVGQAGPGMPSLIGLIAWSLAAAWILFAAMFRRLKDMGFHPMLALLAVVPFVNLLFNLMLLLFPGDAKPNKYGPPPR
jgi:uncharacterized membrane protein YhaH (DUF805 family)